MNLLERSKNNNNNNENDLYYIDLRRFSAAPSAANHDNSNNAH